MCVTNKPAILLIGIFFFSAENVGIEASVNVTSSTEMWMARFQRPIPFMRNIYH